jgi:hypothetical protein
MLFPIWLKQTIFIPVYKWHDNITIHHILCNYILMFNVVSVCLSKMTCDIVFVFLLLFLFLVCIHIYLIHLIHFSLRGEALFNPGTFYWITCTKPSVYIIMYICVGDVSFVSDSTVFKLNLELFWEYGIFFLHFICNYFSF